MGDFFRKYMPYLAKFNYVSEDKALENYKNKKVVFQFFAEELSNYTNYEDKVAALKTLIKVSLGWGANATANDYSRILELVKQYDDPKGHFAAIWYVALVDYECELMSTVVEHFENKFACSRSMALALIVDWMLSAHKDLCLNNDNFISFKVAILQSDPGIVKILESFRAKEESNYTMHDFYDGLSNEYKLGVVL